MKYTNEEILERIKKIDNNDYKCLTKNFDKGIQTKVTLKHKCGFEYQCKLKGFLNENKSRCPKCKTIIHKSTKKISENEFIQRIKTLTNNEYTYISGFKNTKTKCTLKHEICGNIFEVTPNMFLGTKKSRCPICANKNRGKYAIKKNYLKNLLNEAFDGSEYIWLEKYKNNNKIKHKIKHKICNHEYLVRPNDFQQGYRCPYCRQSKGEKKIAHILTENKINFVHDQIYDDCVFINPLKFDFELKDTNNKIIIIEYDGEFHERNPYYEEDLKKQKIRDQIKNNYCQKNNFILYRIHYSKYNELDKIIFDIIKKHNLK